MRRDVSVYGGGAQSEPWRPHIIERYLRKGREDNFTGGRRAEERSPECVYDRYGDFWSLVLPPRPTQDGRDRTPKQTITMGSKLPHRHHTHMTPILYRPRHLPWGDGVGPGTEGSLGSHGSRIQGAKKHQARGWRGGDSLLLDAFESSVPNFGIESSTFDRTGDRDRWPGFGTLRTSELSGHVTSRVTSAYPPHSKSALL